MLLAIVEQKRRIPAPETVLPISARLIFAPATPATAPTEVASPQELPDNAPFAEQLPLADTKPEEQQTDAPLLTPAEMVPTEPVINEVAEQQTPSSEMPVTDVPDSSLPVQADHRATPFTSRKALDAFFSQQQADARQREAEMAASEYRKQQTSPEIVDPRKDEPEEEMNAPPPVNVDCSDTTTSVLAVISTYTGGRVTCSDRSNGFEKFIDKRLNKHIKEEQNR